MAQQFYVRTCPVCDQGLCRVRVYVDDEMFAACVVCDECDATWTDATMTKRYKQSHVESPTFPTNNLPLWSDATHWATGDELIALGWYSKRFVDA